MTAVSKEHVPPKCLFPESKDIFGQNHRIDLITVPSCHVHNSAKSKNDEFLMVSLAGIIGNNGIGFIHTKTKVSRSLRRKSTHFLRKQVVRNSKNGVITLKGIKFPVIFGNPNIPRIINCFENIAYGLYFHEYKAVFKGEVVALMGFLTYEDENRNTFIRF